MSSDSNATFEVQTTLFGGLAAGRPRTDLKGITSAAVPFYASIRCHFMLQVTRVC